MATPPHDPHASSPKTESLPTLGLIGAGRLASALAPALQAAGYCVRAIASRRMASACALAQTLPSAQAMTPQALADACDWVFITTSDAAIEAVATDLSWRAEQSVVHCSGATPVSVLQPVAQAGGHIGGFHPLQAFGGDARAALASLPGCTVAIEAVSPLRERLHDVAARLGCIGMDLPPEARARYHAAGGYASQHVHVLIAEAVRLWMSWGATESEALAALLPLLRGTVETLARRGVADGMPGPISRGDVGTVRTHRQALAALDPEMQTFHDALCLRGLALAVRAGRVSAQQQQNLLALLEESIAPARKERETQDRLIH